MASSSGPTHESGGDVPVVLDTLQSLGGSTKRRVPMQCQVLRCWTLCTLTYNIPSNASGAEFVEALGMPAIGSWRAICIP